MAEFVEPHVRRLVAEHLGVGVEQLVSHVSLRDDLAADSGLLTGARCAAAARGAEPAERISHQNAATSRTG